MIFQKLERSGIWDIAVICGLKGLGRREDIDCQIRDIVVHMMDGCPII